ncbi:MAG: shikimate kinase [Clostridium sp.]
MKIDECKNIVLIGMPGCGKTTVGRILAEILKYEFCDIDNYIEENEDTTINEIFNRGEEVFRDIESRYISQICKKEHCIISTGGGVIKREENIINLKSNGVIFFIDRPIDNILGDIDIESRPLLKDKKEKIYRLYEERYNIYINCCNVKIVNNKSMEDIIKEIKTYLI